MIAGIGSHLSSPVLADWVRAWLVPIVLGVLVLLVAWIGVQWYSSEHLGRLAAVPLFGELSAGQLRALARATARVQLGPGDPIVREREPGDGFYVMQDGSAIVTVAGDRKDSLEPGGYFGEMAVIDGGPRSATVTAETKVTVLKLPSSAFARLLDRDPSIARTVGAELRRRLRDAGAVVPDTDVDPPDRDELVQMCRQLRIVRQTDWGQPRRTRRRWLPF
jgi:CRP/FNR family transcriptional regulator, cyclic AMP receptor protein